MIKIESPQQNPENMQQESVSKKTLLQRKIPNFKTLFSLVKKPKVLTLIIFLFTILLVILTLALLASNKKEEEIVPVFDLSSPSPSPSLDPTLENISKRVKSYNDKLDGLEDYRKRLIYPIVDLDISFDK